MKNKKLIIALLFAVAVRGYFISIYTTGEKLCQKLGLENSKLAMAYYDNGGKDITSVDYSMQFTDSQSELVIDYIKGLQLKKHRESYMDVTNFEMYTFDFHFDKGRTVVYLISNEYVQVVSPAQYTSVIYRIVK